METFITISSFFATETGNGGEDSNQAYRRPFFWRELFSPLIIYSEMQKYT